MQDHIIREIEGDNWSVGGFLRRVLFVCSANHDRSPTAERLFNHWNNNWEAKSAGILPYARTRLTQDLIDWDDLILVMEQYHSEFIYANFNCDANKKVIVLGISDIYPRDDPELVQELKHRVTPILQRG